MLKHIIDFEVYDLLEGILNDKEPKKLKITKDKETGEKIIDKSQIPPDEQIRVLCKELYKATIESGRYQSMMNDKMQAMQQAGAGEAEMQQIQQLMQDQMQGLQMRAMDLEMYVQSVGGMNQQLMMMAQKLTGEAKMLADKANKEYFDKKMKKTIDMIDQQLKQKQAEAAKKQQAKEQAKGESNGDNQGEDEKDKN